jgi:hypothetical protein
VLPAQGVERFVIMRVYLDACSLPAASWTKADYFCACDDKLLKKSKKLKTLATKVVSPLELIAEVTR